MLVNACEQITIKCWCTPISFIITHSSSSSTCCRLVSQWYPRCMVPQVFPNPFPLPLGRLGQLPGIAWHWDPSVPVARQSDQEPSKPSSTSSSNHQGGGMRILPTQPWSGQLLEEARPVQPGVWLDWHEARTGPQSCMRSDKGPSQPGGWDKGSGNTWGTTRTALYEAVSAQSTQLYSNKSDLLECFEALQ